MINKDQSGSSDIAFIHVEACGEGRESWPVEVAWGFASGAARSVLVRPADGWSMSAWEKAAEKRHRISPPSLVTEGRAAIDVALVLNAALGGARVFAARPEFYSFWLFRLYHAAGVKPNYQLHDFADLMGENWREQKSDLIALARRQVPFVGRAAPEVEFLQVLVGLADARTPEQAK